MDRSQIADALPDAPSRQALSESLNLLKKKGCVTLSKEHRLGQIRLAATLTPNGLAHVRGAIAGAGCAAPATGTNPATLEELEWLRSACQNMDEPLPEFELSDLYEPDFGELMPV
jgi:hypothetical protein